MVLLVRLGAVPSDGNIANKICSLERTAARAYNETSRQGDEFGRPRNKG